MKTNLPSIFRYEDVKDMFPSKTAFNFYVIRNVKNDKLIRVKNGLFIKKEFNSKGLIVDKNQIASHLFEDSFFTSIEALRFYFEQFNYRNIFDRKDETKFYYFSQKRARPLEFKGTTYVWKKAITTLQVNFGVFNGVNIASLERAIVDFIDNYDKDEFEDIPIWEISDALKACKNDIDPNKIIEMLKHYDKNFLYQKIGYLFERSGLSQDVIDLCKQHIGQKVYYFVSKRSTAVYCSDWKLITDDYKDKIME